jgi:hypothetical protein
MARSVVWGIVVVLGCVGCSTKGTPRGDGGTGSDVGFGDTGGPDTTVRPPPDADLTGCTASSAMVEEGFAPIDIIYVVDSSGSMSNEAERVQENMNEFSRQLGLLELDYHVVMITTSSYVSVPPPLGTDTERYMLIDRPVSSHEPLQALLDEYPTYSSFLRRSAITHFVAVTDDESDVTAADFRARMEANLMRNFTFHAIASEEGPTSLTNPEGACQVSSGFPPEGAAAPGIQYYDLARLTGGLTFSICTPAGEWASLFDSLTTAIAVPMALPCRYEVPLAPDGMELDPFRVNVVYTSGSGAEQVLPYAGGTAGEDPDCTGGGWYYESDAQDVILICPNTCSMIEADAEGRLDLAFGCMTVFI